MTEPTTPQANPSQPNLPEIVTLEPQPAAVLREVVPMADLPAYFDRAFHAVMRAMGDQGIAPVGPAFAAYFGMPTDVVDVGAGFPTDRPVTPDAGVTALTLPGGRAAQIVHAGAYDQLPATYAHLMNWLGEQHLAVADLMWETYLTEPDPGHPEATRTLIVWPLAQ